MLLFEWITQNPILSGTKLIIEPWNAAEVLQSEQVFPSEPSEVERTPPG
jgi:pullulanase/glycogen debranching enzyme